MQSLSSPNDKYHNLPATQKREWWDSKHLLVEGFDSLENICRATFNQVFFFAFWRSFSRFFCLSFAPFVFIWRQDRRVFYNVSEAPNLTSFVACQFWLLPLQKIELAETSIFARNILFEDYWGERQNISSSSVKVTNLLTFVIPTNTKKSWELKFF